jgi:hypothetical protein
MASWDFQKSKPSQRQPSMIGRPAAVRGHVCATRRRHRSQGSDSAGGLRTMAALLWRLSIRPDGA